MLLRYLIRLRRRGKLWTIGSQPTWRASKLDLFPAPYVDRRTPSSQEVAWQRLAPTPLYPRPLNSTTSHAPIADTLFSSTHRLPASYTTLLLWKRVRNPPLALTLAPHTLRKSRSDRRFAAPGGRPALSYFLTLNCSEQDVHSPTPGGIESPAGWCSDKYYASKNRHQGLR